MKNSNEVDLAWLKVNKVYLQFHLHLQLKFGELQETKFKKTDWQTYFFDGKMVVLYNS